MLAAIPCDLTRQVYCHLPGSAYPWHAVRRFVHENHGLMKRMYGDVRHISVLRDEIFNNEIDTDGFEDVAERYSKNPHRERSSKYMHTKYEEYGSVKNNGDELPEPHFREVSTPTKTPPTVAPLETIREESTSVANDRKEAKMKDEHAVRIGDGGSIRRRVNATTNGGSDGGGGGGGHRRRINVYINRNRPLHSSLRRRTTTPTTEKTTSTTTSTTTTTTEEPKFFVDNTEQASVSTVNDDEAIHQISEYDSNIASNSVYEIPTSSEVVLLPGDNIQIIESPQLGQLQKPLTEQTNNTEAATISTTLKVVSKPPEKLGPKLDSPAPVTQTPLQKRPLNVEVERQRPPQTIKLQQVKKPNKPNEVSDTKKSAISKLKTTNESERQQINSVAASMVNTSAANQPLSSVAIENEHTDITTGDVNDSAGTSTIGGTASFDSDDAWVPATAAVTSASTAETNMDLQPHQSDDANKADFAKPPPTTTVKQATTTTTTTQVTSSVSAAEISEEIVAHVEQQSMQAAETPISATAAASTKPLLRDGQLYQDAVKQEVKPPPNMRGINACPGKEEVVAPFWANNTRGEVLALLNLYPFEQYVHWEKCTHENRQMYCREGCRCEQQYRLHRLLAYDPHNECRGIFSDWFRFPSCCICKCYGIPMEFRATSRSPRSERIDDFETAVDGDNFEEEFVDDPVIEREVVEEPQQRRQHPLDVAERMVRQAIYEHATEDWYRPRDDFEFYDD